MTRRIEARRALEVYLSDPGYICIKQEASAYGEEDTVVTIHPEDISKVIDWLQEVADEREELVAQGNLDPSPDRELEKIREAEKATVS